MQVVKTAGDLLELRVGTMFCSFFRVEREC